MVVTCYNVNSACRKHCDSFSSLSYELALPPTAGISVSRIQVLVNLLTCMDILAQNSSMFPIGITSSQNNIPVGSNTIETKKEYLHINRFASMYSMLFKLYINLNINYQISFFRFRWWLGVFWAFCWSYSFFSWL